MTEEEEVQEARAEEEQPETPPEEEETTNQDKATAALSYIVGFILSAVVLLTKEMSARPFQRYHAIQSLGVWVASVLYEAVMAILVCAISVTPLAPLDCCLWVAFFLPLVPTAYFAYRAYLGEYFAIPFLTDFMRQQGWL